MSSDSLRDKLAFFASLDDLDGSVGDKDDQIDQEEQRHREKCRAFFGSKQKRLKTLAAPEAIFPAPRRTASAPTPSTLPRRSEASVEIIKATPAAQNVAVASRRRAHARSLTTDTLSFVAETPVPDSNGPGNPSLVRRATVPLSTAASGGDQSPSMASVLKKRKRQTSTKPIVPESERWFKDLAFYYIPNNGISPARKLRITKAQEYGARWIRTLSGASHVIVDKHLAFKDIERFLGPASASSLVIVNEHYPVDCVSFGALLNPDQHKYRVPGCPISTASPPCEPPETIPSSQNSDRSLPLKKPQRNPRRWDHVPREGTPPRSEESSLQTGMHAGSAEKVYGALERPLSGEQLGASLVDDKSRHYTPSTPVEIHLPGSMAPREGILGCPMTSPKDELSDFIGLMQKYKHLPLDVEEDDAQSVGDIQEAISDSESGEGSEAERSRKKRLAKNNRRGQKAIANEDRFACNEGGRKDNPTQLQNPNSRTIEILQSMCDYYTQINDHWRILAYRKAISTLRRQTSKVTTEEEAYTLPSIGKRLAMKIEEIVSTDKLRRLDYANDKPLDQVLALFLKIYDVGTSRANKWVAQGFRTLQDLKDKAPLTTNQRIGIDHFDDLNTRIPRSEVTALGDYVKKEAAKLDPDVELLVGGSYRRGSESSGDIDFIVTKKDTTSVGELVPFLKELIDVLTEKGFLVATLAALHSSRQGKDGPGSKWHGCCVLPASNDAAAAKPIWRRIDFLLVPESEYGAALIYFTGNDIFNRSLRLLASKKGMRLNQRGLYREVMRGPGRVKVREGELVEGRDEKRIFEVLDVKWREPWERWC
ncbi:hypothetical protein B0H66DRAFT_541780 [Apodospora peruviana]|uniref:DNA polymerase lambda n=1 Tax=Apodospora peruviana TaxID=516989 RepID=A0AAE0IRF7_9PEZI|nr:hypothetical protein B0H66DRAFT_541780 [Apodospora peruviana]